VRKLHIKLNHDLNCLTDYRDDLFTMRAMKAVANEILCYIIFLFSVYFFIRRHILLKSNSQCQIRSDNEIFILVNDNVFTVK
jgi:hypothetical protein